MLLFVFIAGCGQSTETALTDDIAQTGSAALQGTANDGTASPEVSGQQDESASQSDQGGTTAAGEQQPSTDGGNLEAIASQIPDDIKDYLINNAQKLIDEYRPDTPGLSEPIKISEVCSIIDYAAGSLDSDGYDELAVITENSEVPDEETGSASRWILILSRRGQERYEIVNYNPGFILSAEEGGVFGDPYNSISINDNILSVVHYGGSNYRWGYVHEFAYEGDTLRLLRLTETDEFTGTGNGTETVYDFKESGLKQFAEYVDSSEEKLIYECTLPKSDFLFERFRIEDMNDAAYTARYLPDLGAYDYVNGTVIGTKTSPDAVLDTIKQKWFRDFNKIDFSWTEETRKNYASVCFFEPAGYYYEKDGSTLQYWSVEKDDSGNASHIVLLNSTDDAGQPKCNFYYYDDRTGEIDIQ
ncbi:MAG TPA: hypothetical protein VHT96_18430 [Clostridia bacterium]|nr:hypothetical protein [Clostridia bacterium]